MTVHDVKRNDTWYYSDQILKSGKIYGLVGEYGQGCEYLSYLIGGRLEFGNIKIYCNNALICQNDLHDIAWNLEPYCEPYGKSI